MGKGGSWIATEGFFLDFKPKSALRVFVLDLDFGFSGIYPVAGPDCDLAMGHQEREPELSKAAAIAEAGDAERTDSDIGRQRVSERA
jgi:hypothetical protein